MRILSRLRYLVWLKLYTFLYLDTRAREIEKMQKQIRNLYSILEEEDEDEDEDDYEDEIRRDYYAELRFYERIGVTEWQFSHMTIEQEARLERAIQEIFGQEMK